MSQFITDHAVCEDINSASGTLAVGNDSRVAIGRRGSAVSILGDLLVTGPLTVNSQSSGEFVLPLTRGTANQILISDGQGLTTWSSAPPPPGIATTIQDTAGTTKWSCATAGNIEGSLPGSSNLAFQASSLVVALATPSYGIGSGSFLSLFDDGSWTLKNGSGSGSLAASSDSQPASLELLSVDSKIELRDSQMQLSISSVLRDTLDATKREFLGTDAAARVTIDNAGVAFGSGLNSYRFPNSGAGSASLSLISDGSVLHFQRPAKLESADTQASVSCSALGETTITNNTHNVFETLGTHTRIASPTGNEWVQLDDSDASATVTAQTVNINCTSFKLNGSAGANNQILTSISGNAVWSSDAILDSVTSELLNFNGPMSIGPSAEALLIGSSSATSGISIGGPNVATKIDGSITTIETQLKVPSISATGVLSLGTHLPTNGVNIGYTNSMTSIGGPMTVTQTLNAPTIDVLSSGMTIGGTVATTVSIGNANVGTNAVNIAAPRLNASVIDVSAGALSIGTTTSNAITIGKLLATTTVNGTLSVSGAYSFPVTLSASGQVLQSNGSNLVFGKLNISSMNPFSSADFQSVLSTSTGSGLVVFDNSPTLITPNIGAATATSIDSATTLAIGGTSATTVSIGKSASSIINVLSPRMNVLAIDRSSPGTLTIGATSGTIVTIGNSGTTVVNINPPRLNANAWDRATSGSMSIGATSSTTVSIGRNLLGNAVNIVAPRLNTAAIDIVSSGTLKVGTQTANGIEIGTLVGSLGAGITIGGVNVRTTINGTFTRIGTSLITPNIDAPPTTTLAIGALTANAITINQLGQTTRVNGTLNVNGAYDFPAAAASSKNQVLASSAPPVITVWKRPGGFIQTFGGNVSGSNYFLVNGTFSSLGVVSAALGGEFVVPVDCILQTASYTLSASAAIMIVAGASSRTSGSVSNKGIYNFTEVSLVQGDIVTVKLDTAASGLVTLYFE